MENKYYTPDIEDIHIGYEGLYRNQCRDIIGNKDLNFDRWDKTVLNKYNVETILKYGINDFKTAYLTKEQIKNEGWLFLEAQGPNTDFIDFIIKKEIIADERYINSLYLEYNLETRDMRIYEDEGDYQHYFDGLCKSINELRTIMRLLQI